LSETDTSERSRRGARSRTKPAADGNTPYRIRRVRQQAEPRRPRVPTTCRIRRMGLVAIASAGWKGALIL
jgi:hypothetical protein